MGIRIERNFPVYINGKEIEITVIADGDHSQITPDYSVLFQCNAEKVSIVLNGNELEECEVFDSLIQGNALQRINKELSYSRIMFEVGYHMQ